MSIKKQRYASLCTKRREGVFHLRLKRYKFRPHQSNSHTDEKVKIYYKVSTNFTKIIQMSLKLCTTASSVSIKLRIIDLQHHHRVHNKAVIR
jgi:hypothetical protein